jgi:cell division protein ZapA (FtsZ GTPase activity inhibitor)
MRKVWLLSLLAAILVSLGIFTLNLFGKEDNIDSKSDIRIISEKIERVLKNQEDIIARLTDIRQELDVIRIRASRR